MLVRGSPEIEQVSLGSKGQEVSLQMAPSQKAEADGRVPGAETVITPTSGVQQLKEVKQGEARRRNLPQTMTNSHERRQNRNGGGTRRHKLTEANRN